METDRSRHTTDALVRRLAVRIEEIERGVIQLEIEAGIIRSARFFGRRFAGSPHRTARHVPKSRSGAV
jgi:hypothetical protein